MAGYGASYGNPYNQSTGDDLYEGFGSNTEPFRGGNITGGGAAPLPMPSMAPMAGQPMGPLRVPQSRGGPPPGTRAGAPMSHMGGPLGTAGGGGAGATEEARPMTAVRAAGYTAAGKRPGSAAVFDPAGIGASRGPAPPLQKRADNSPEDLCREMEKEVNGLIEESAQLNLDSRYGEALEKAKEAGKRERKLCQKRDEAGLSDQVNIDLTYSVFFNLANQYHANGLYVEALKTYSMIVKNKQYHQSGRLRVNMGNIYFEQKKYPNAIKMYRMALDQIPNTGKEIRSKIIRNIGVAFVRLGQFQDAIASFEQIMEGYPDVQTGFNLFLCYYALGEAEKMRKVFARLLSVRLPGMGDVEDEEEMVVGMEDVLKEDGLKEALRKKHKESSKYISVAAKLLAPLIEGDVAAGYDWVITQLRTANHASLANEMEIAKSLHFMRARQFDRAVEALKSYEKKDHQLVARAATNLSFIYFHEADYNSAIKYADVAMRHNRYNAKALVNKGNCLFMKHEFESARAMYQESMGADADCIEAIYNLGLVNKRMALGREAFSLFEKLHAIIPSSIEVVWQIADLQESFGSPKVAIKWFNILSSRVPTDPGVLSRLGNIYLKEEDESQAYHYHLESYRHYPVNMNVISWLGAYSVKYEMYEKAVQYFERASQIQPSEVKWKLMVASCHRRSGDYQIAFDIYQQIHKDFPDNVECAACGACTHLPPSLRVCGAVQSHCLPALPRPAHMISPCCLAQASAILCTSRMTSGRRIRCMSMWSSFARPSEPRSNNRPLTLLARSRRAQ